MRRLTIDEATAFLNVRSAYVRRLIEQRQLRADTDGRLDLTELVKFKERERARTLQALADLVDDAQDLGIYEE